MEQPPTISELIEAAQAGQAGAFNELIRFYRPRVLAWARHILSDPDELDDVVQEVLIRIWTALRSYRAQGSFGAWVWAITRNAAVQRLRGSSMGPVLVRGNVPGLPARGRDPLEGLCARDLHGRVVACFRDLPEPQRRACELVDGSGLSPGEAAEALGVPAGTLRSSLCRGRRAVRRALLGEGGWEAAG